MIVNVIGNDLHGSSRQLVDLGPDARARDQAIARESKDCATGRLSSSEAHKLQNNDGADSVEDTATLAKRVVEDLSYGLGCWRCQDPILGLRVAHAEAENNVEQPAGKICEQHSH